MAALLRLLPYILGSVVILGLLAGGPWVYIAIVEIFIFHPILDNIFKNKINNDDGQKHRGYLEGLLFIYPIFHTIVLGVGIFTFTKSNLWWEQLGIILSTGILTGGLGITAAHELVHKPTIFQRALGVYLLATVNYSHFRIEHVFGHHRKVGTPEDPASAPLGQSLYSFLPQSLIGSYLSAWNIEKKINSGLSNRMHQYLLTSLSVSIILACISLPLLVFWWTQSFIAILLLEVINYIEHYGLERKEVAPGQYERVLEKHSWDSDFAITNFALFNLGKHSHHHAAASVAYPDLKNDPNSPKLPMGYSGAIILATLPPLWKMVMDKRALALRDV